MKNYIGLYRTFSSYFKAYGGLRAIFESPYFHIALLFSTAVYVWVHCFGNELDFSLYELSLSILPNLLGFSIGVYAILLAVGDEGFWKILYEREDEEVESISLSVNASLAHFVIVQVIALFTSVIGKVFSIENNIFVFISTTLFMYAILMGLASVMVIFTISKWYQSYIDKKHKE